MAFISNVGLAFEEVVRLHGARPALRLPSTGEQVSYAQLHHLTNQAAARLCAKGLRPGDVVVMFHDKSPEAFAGQLACLRLGLPYATLDPDSPWERVYKIIQTCQPACVLNGFENLPFAQELAAAGLNQQLHLRERTPDLSLASLPPPELVGGGQPAYIMFTSGSTGMPKGAVMSHANVLGLVRWAQHRFDLKPEDRLTNVNPIYFDNSVFDFYSALLTGACLVPFTPPQVKDARQLVRSIGASMCTLWFSVPSLLVYLLVTRALGAQDFPHVRCIAFGGEGFPKPKLQQLHALLGHRVRLENVYGPTECTCICSAKTIVPSDFEDMQNLTALGQLAQNFDYEILPQDAANPDFGELFLRGPQVGLGYFRDPKRTAQAFIQNPLHTNYTDRGYRTGDLVERDSQGQLHFKGRADFQIKHMGYRIELEEIEAALSTIGSVHECAVIYDKREDGLGQILAFAAVDATTQSSDILTKLAALVPPYMLPKRVTLVPALPKNANGKIDRAALKAL